MLSALSRLLPTLLGSRMDHQELVPFLETNLSRQLHWISAADSKTAFAFTLATVMLGVLAARRNRMMRRRGTRLPNTGNVGGCGGSEQCVLDERLARPRPCPGQVDRETGKEPSPGPGAAPRTSGVADARSLCETTADGETIATRLEFSRSCRHGGVR